VATRDGDATLACAACGQIGATPVLAGDWKPALSTTETARARAPEQAEGIYGPLLHRVRGYALAQSGQHVEARGALEASLRLARSMESDYDAALALHALSRLTEAEGGSIDDSALDEMQDIFDRFGVVAVPE